ncbi:transcriptional regulator, TetR family [Serratia sp. CC22-02]|uniref:TetR/AcrR family transcriptional regulator n=1 Tax=Serratia sp. CC22-02 TaxID=1378076 RepID=UPI002403770B|nr:TetR/AcrR family transcriptional regulator [Serratia sp. CC22-02]SMP82411.1 transcriptional regulator, TetR family [Serratia sp. CC22-02]
MSEQLAAIPSRRTQRQMEQPRRGDEKERAILEAAERAVRNGTFESVTISAMAASAGVSRSSFYFYFASKDALLATLIEQVLVDNLSNLKITASRQDTDLPSKLHEAVSYISHTWIIHREILCAAVELSHRMPAIAELWSNAILGSVEIFIERLDFPSLTSTDPAFRRQAHILAWAQERNLYHLAKSGGDINAFEVLAQDLTNMWLTFLQVSQECPCSKNKGE